MDILELRMNYSAFIKLRNFIKINEISAEIKEYVKKNDVVNGKLDVSGNYLEDDLVKSHNFNEEIPFSIIFTSGDFEVIDIDCINLDYQTIDGRGIEVIFDVLIKYEDFSLEEKENTVTDEDCSDENIIEIPVLVNELDLEYEEIKKEKEIEVDRKIIEQLDQVFDHNPTDEEEVTVDDKDEEKVEKKRIIKVKYFNDNKELDNVCTDLNIGIDKIFNDNKNTDFVKYKRVIIK